MTKVPTISIIEIKYNNHGPTKPTIVLSNFLDIDLSEIDQQFEQSTEKSK
jgi:hypothetical protein